MLRRVTLPHFYYQLFIRLRLHSPKQLPLHLRFLSLIFHKKRASFHPDTEALVMPLLRCHKTLVANE